MRSESVSRWIAMKSFYNCVSVYEQIYHTISNHALDKAVVQRQAAMRCRRWNSACRQHYVYTGYIWSQPDHSGTVHLNQAMTRQCQCPALWWCPQALKCERVCVSSHNIRTIALPVKTNIAALAQLCAVLERRCYRSFWFRYCSVHYS